MKSYYTYIVSRPSLNSACKWRKRARFLGIGSLLCVVGQSCKLGFPPDTLRRNKASVALSMMVSSYKVAVPCADSVIYIIYKSPAIYAYALCVFCSCFVLWLTPWCYIPIFWVTSHGPSTLERAFYRPAGYIKDNPPHSPPRNSTTKYRAQGARCQVGVGHTHTISRVYGVQIVCVLGQTSHTECSDPPPKVPQIAQTRNVACQTPPKLATQRDLGVGIRKHGQGARARLFRNYVRTVSL